MTKVIAEFTDLFAEEIPEIGNGLVEIKAVARLPGIRSKLAVRSASPTVDAINACVGQGGCRLHRIIDRLGGERIELVAWHDAPESLIAHALQPAKVERVILDAKRQVATVIVKQDQLSLVQGARGSQNRELASQISGWDIDVRCEEAAGHVA